MFSKPQNHHKSPPIPNFAIIPNAFDIKKHAQPHSTPRFPPKPANSISSYRKYLKFDKFCLHPRKLGDP